MPYEENGGVDEGDISPTATVILTPEPGSPDPTYTRLSDHSVLSQLAKEPIQFLSSPLEAFHKQRASFPLLSPHNPLRAKLFSIAERQETSHHKRDVSKNGFFDFGKVSIIVS